VALVVRGDYQQFREALALLDRNRRGGDVNADDLRARILVLLAHPAHRREAIRALEELSKLQPLKGEGHALLARLFEAEGNWPKARDAFQNALSAGGDDPSLLASYARGLLRQDNLGEAKTILSLLQQRQPQAYDTLALQARLLAMQGRGEEVTRLVQDFTRPREGVAPEQVAERARAGAVLLDELGREFKPIRTALGPAAEELYRNYVAGSQAKHPESVLELAGYLGRQGQTDQALEYCRQGRGRCKPEAVAATTAAVFGAGEPRKADDEEALQWLAGEIRKNPRSVALVQSLAALHDNRGRPDQAEAGYRKVLQMDPGNVMALNNLAFLLAVRGAGAAEALELITRALRVAGPTAELLDTRAQVYLALGRGEKARDDLAEAIGQQPRTAVYQFHLAEAYRAAGNRDEADKALEQAKALGLEAGSLHPLERGRSRQVLEDLR
jgi:tetratricopeptide (TPR) repeat protein